MKKPTKRTVGDFLAGRGFYIVLFLCVTAIGVSGWYLMSELMLNQTGEPVTGPATVTVSPTPSPSGAVPPSLKPTPTPTPRPSATPTPKPTEAPALSLWGSEVYTWPVKGEVIADFSLEVLAYDETMADWRVHQGVDIATSVGTSVKAMNAGTVSAVYVDDLMGTVVEVEHDSGFTSLYANLAAQPPVKVGDALDTGAVLGTVGQTAIAEVGKPDHLHLEMSKEGLSVDPIPYLPAQ